MSLRIAGLMAALALVVGCAAKPTVVKDDTTTIVQQKDPVTIGFIVKQMDDTWFQQETRFARDRAKELGVELLVQEAKTGEALLASIDSIASQGADGLIVCAPEVKLGTAILAAAEAKNMKLMSVDDRLVDTSGEPLEDVPHLGISARNIGKLAGEAIVAEMKARGWKAEETGAIAILKEGLETAQQRIDGAKEVLMANGFKPVNIFIGPWKGATDIASANDAANAIVTRETGYGQWVVFSSNDDGVIGAVRALESAGLKPDAIIGVGINGTTAAQEFDRGKPTGLYASILLSPRTHGAKTVEMMVEWIRTGKAPEKETYTSGTVINRENYLEELKREGVEP